MDILCTDKTGTLTEGAIVLSDVLDAGNRASDEVRRLAFLNAAFETGIENPLDAAIVAAGESAGLTTRGFAEDRRNPLRLHPPAPHHRRGGGRCAVAAPHRHQGRVRERARHLLVAGTRRRRESRWMPERRAELEEVFKAKGAEGFRVLAVATRKVGGEGALQPRRRTGHDLSRLSRLLRSAQGGRATHDPRPQPTRHPHQGDQRRQSLCDGASGGGCRPRRKVDAHRRRACDAQGRGVVASRAAHRSLRRDRPAAEGADRPRPAANRALGRLSRRRHQRCAGPACGRCRHLGRGGRGCRARERRHHPAAPRSGRAAFGRRGRQADLRQHAQVHLDHHQREFREHGQHGAGDAAAAVPAARRQADPAQQLSLRRAVDRDLERQCRSGPGLTPAALEHQGHPAAS